MPSYLSISLYIEKEKVPLSFEDFETKMKIKLRQQLTEWSAEPLYNYSTAYSYIDNDDTNYLRDISKARKYLSNTINSHYHIKEMEINNKSVFSINFNIQKIKTQIPSIKVKDILLNSKDSEFSDISKLMEDLIIQIKSSFYFENMDYLLENKGSKLTVNHLNWMYISKQFKRIVHELEY